MTEKTLHKNKTVFGGTKDFWGLCFSLAGLLFFIAPFLFNITHLSKNPDWVQAFAYAAAARDSMLRFHQFPLWSNLFCGGYPLVANPYDFSLSLFFPVVLVAGEIAGVKLAILFLWLSGFFGMFYLTRNVLNYNLGGALFSSLVFALCSWWAAAARSGNFTKFYFCLLPIVLGFFIKTRDDRRFLAGSAVVLAALLFQAGFVYFVTLLLLFLYSFTELFRARPKFSDRTKYFQRFFAVTLFSLLLAAPRVLPAVELLQSSLSKPHDRIQKDYSDFCKIAEAVDLQKLFMNATIPPGRSSAPYHDYGHSLMFVGPIPFILFLLGSMLLFGKNRRHLFVLLFILLISMGCNGRVDIYKFLWKALFPFREIYKLDKYFVPLILFLGAIIAGSFFSVIRGKRRGVRCVVTGLLLFFSITPLAGARWMWEGIFDIPPPHLMTESDFFQTVFLGQEAGKQPDQRTNFYSLEQYYNVKRGIGTINAVIPVTFGENTVPKLFYRISRKAWRDRTHDLDVVYQLPEANPLYRGEAFLGEQTAGILKVVSMTPRKIEIKVHLKKRGDVLINQNFSPWWRANAGRLIPRQGLLCVAGVTEGEHHIVLKYQPATFYAGAGISLISLLILLNIKNIPLIRSSSARTSHVETNQGYPP